MTIITHLGTLTMLVEAGGGVGTRVVGGGGRSVQCDGTPVRQSRALPDRDSIYVEQARGALRYSIVRSYSCFCVSVFHCRLDRGLTQPCNLFRRAEYRRK
jgi:hypothetical protein